MIKVGHKKHLLQTRPTPLPLPVLTMLAENTAIDESFFNDL